MEKTLNDALKELQENPGLLDNAALEALTKAFLSRVDRLSHAWMIACIAELVFSIAKDRTREDPPLVTLEQVREAARFLGVDIGIINTYERGLPPQYEYIDDDIGLWAFSVLHNIVSGAEMKKPSEVEQAVIRNGVALHHHKASVLILPRSEAIAYAEAEGRTYTDEAV